MRTLNRVYSNSQRLRCLLALILAIAVDNPAYSQWELVVPRFTQINQLIPLGNKLVIAGKGIYVSDDYGDSWTPIRKGLPTRQFINQILAMNSGLFAAIGPFGVYQSADSGNSWEPIGNGIDSNISVDNLAEHNSLLIAGTTHGCLVLKDNRWMEFNDGLSRYCRVISFAQCEGKLFALVETRPYNYALYRLNDPLLSWELVDHGQALSMPHDTSWTNLPIAHLPAITAHNGSIFQAGYMSRKSAHVTSTTDSRSHECPPIFRTSPTHIEWENVGCDIPIDSYYTDSGGLLFSLGEHGLLLTNFVLGIARSIDNGRTWMLMNEYSSSSPGSTDDHLVPPPYVNSCAVLAPYLFVANYDGHVWRHRLPGPDDR